MDKVAPHERLGSPSTKAPPQPRRLRKKPHLDEFQQLGFDHEITWSAKLSIDEQERILDQLLDGTVEPRGLIMGGGLNCGFVSKRKGSPNKMTAWPSRPGCGVGQACRWSTWGRFVTRGTTNCRLRGVQIPGCTTGGAS